MAGVAPTAHFTPHPSLPITVWRLVGIRGGRWVGRPRPPMPAWRGSACGHVCLRMHRPQRECTSRSVLGVCVSGILQHWWVPKHPHHARPPISLSSLPGIAWYIAAADMINEQYKRVRVYVLCVVRCVVKEGRGGVSRAQKQWGAG